MMNYTHDFLLGRINDNLRLSDKNNLDKPKIYIENRKSIFENFVPICKQIKRDPEGMKNYICEQLDTTSSVDSKGKMIFAQTFNSNHIKTHIADYLKNFVQCKECSSFSTELSKDGKMSYIFCLDCLSKKSITK